MDLDAMRAQLADAHRQRARREASLQTARDPRAAALLDRLIRDDEDRIAELERHIAKAAREVR